MHSGKFYLFVSLLPIDVILSRAPKYSNTIVVHYCWLMPQRENNQHLPLCTGLQLYHMPIVSFSSLIDAASKLSLKNVVVAAFVLLILHSFLYEKSVTSALVICYVSLCPILVLTSDCAYVEKHVCSQWRGLSERQLRHLLQHSRLLFL